MKAFATQRPSKNSNLIVKELNANILTGTFPEKLGTFQADLYTNIGQCPCLVFVGSCAPILGTFVKTVKIKLQGL